MKTIPIALHQLSANWPELRRTSVLVGLGIVVGSWLIFVELPGKVLWTNAFGAAGRCVLASVWALVCVSLLIFIARDRLGDQSQFFQTRPVPRWLRLSSSSLLAVLICMLLAFGPVVFGAWLFNFPPGWTQLAARWIGVGLFVLMLVLALVWSRSRDGWLLSRLLLAGIGVFLGFLILGELRGWVPSDGFAWLEQLPAWTPALILAPVCALVLWFSLRRAGGLPAATFVAFGALGSIVILGGVGWRSSQTEIPEPEFAEWGARFLGGEIDAATRPWSLDDRDGFELTMPEFDRKRCALNIGFSGRLVDASGAELLKLPRVLVKRGGKVIEHDQIGWQVLEHEAVAQIAGRLGLDGAGDLDRQRRALKVEVGSADLRLRIISKIQKTDEVRKIVEAGGEFFVEGEIEVLYREFEEIGRGSLADGVKAKVPGVRVSLEPLASKVDPNDRRIVARVLHSPPPNPSRQSFPAHQADEFLIFVDPAGSEEPWRAYSMTKTEGGGWWPEFGDQWVIDRAVRRGLKDGGEFICVAQYPAKQVKLSVRLKVRNLDVLGKPYDDNPFR